MKSIADTLHILTRIVVSMIKTPLGHKLDYFLSKVNPKLIGKPLPWMNYHAIDYISELPKENLKIFEYGSGSSTLYWVSAGSEVVSVEHDKEFYNELSVKLNGSIKYLLIEPELRNSDVDYNPASPDLFQSSDFRGYSFEKYVKAIDVFQDEFFDIVVIDGRARPSCIKRAISKVKRGGKLIIDNSDRDYYLSLTSEMLVGWSKRIFRGTVRGLLHQEQTSIYIKP